MCRTTVFKYLLVIILCVASATAWSRFRYNLGNLKFSIKTPGIPTLTISKTEKKTAGGILVDTNGSWTLSWTASNNATTYILEESAGGGAFGEVYRGSGRSKTIHAKRVNTEYYYRIKACNRSRCSAASAAKKGSLIEK